MAYPSLATLANLYAYGAPSSAFGSLSDPQRQAGLDGAAQVFLGFAASRGNLPLVGWGSDVIQSICHVATYDLLARVGFNPNDGADVNYVTRKDDAIKWWSRFSKGEVTPPSILFSTAKSIGSFPKVTSRPIRGW